METTEARWVPPTYSLETSLPIADLPDGEYQAALTIGDASALNGSVQVANSGISFEDGRNVLAPIMVSTTTEVTPVAPAQSGAQVTIPEVNGVAYSQRDEDSTLTPLAAGSVLTLSDGETVTIVATPEDGYAFPDATTTEWTFTFTAQDGGDTPDEPGTGEEPTGPTPGDTPGGSGTAQPAPTTPGQGASLAETGASFGAATWASAAAILLLGAGACGLSWRLRKN